MSIITAADTLNMPISERIQLVEDIWDTIAENIELYELNAQEKEIINNRLEAYHKNPDAGSPWQEVYERIINNNAI
jgi:putative addiction module component (TIGR02574 family)